MKKITRILKGLSFAALAALMFVGFDTPTANAYGFGISIGGPNVRLNVGTPSRYYGGTQQVYRRSYSNPRWYGSSNYAYGGGAYGGQANYYRHGRGYNAYSGRNFQHGNHYSYVPSRYPSSRQGPRDRQVRDNRGRQHDDRHHDDRPRGGQDDRNRGGRR